MNAMISTTILLILIMDPLGNLPIVMSILKNLTPKRRIFVLLREMVIALGIMIFFLLAGEKTLAILDLKAETVSISGGIILFLIAIKMIFPDEQQTKKKNDLTEPFLVPLAIPLVAGPSLLATLMLLSHQYSNQILTLSISLLIAWSTTVIILVLSDVFLKFLGEKGVNALERLMGLILIMLSTQMFLDGITTWCKL
ncbi:YhgN family NAAT transporter [Buchnera aphidicola (Takecallis taiwana)]|uniref:YhgN family NAAT transporter n=1 Tax=Buchnera aphidicola TaxID=9 RepID=UPI0031B6C376